MYILWTATCDTKKVLTKISISSEKLNNKIRIKKENIHNWIDEKLWFFPPYYEQIVLISTNWHWFFVFCIYHHWIFVCPIFGLLYELWNRIEELSSAKKNHVYISLRKNWLNSKYITVWWFSNFSATLILRDINFGWFQEVKNCHWYHFCSSDVEFLGCFWR